MMTPHVVMLWEKVLVPYRGKTLLQNAGTLVFCIYHLYSPIVCSNQPVFRSCGSSGLVIAKCFASYASSAGTRI